MATFELYRWSTIDTCLTETLDEMVQSGTVSPELAILVVNQFYVSMTEALESQVKSKVSIKIKLRFRVWQRQTSLRKWDDNESAAILDFATLGLFSCVSNTTSGCIPPYKLAISNATCDQGQLQCLDFYSAKRGV
ncbi:hypothetical protein MLD38_034521 [Melastoma candidum]|uniref:Uncharacterized protein n=1 Tax=Melastoma candidum TaxID=119954 RepID=A0ACB9MC35_9MYRT|nr:hypothetical protein MLD38_034521 [Melastoma candidum]